MKRIAVLVSGGGTNLQAIIDAVSSGKISGVSISLVLSNNHGAYALTRAREAGIPAEVLSPKDFADRADFDKALCDRLTEGRFDLIVLAGFLVTIPDALIEAYSGRMINVHPSLIPSFCGKGFYGLKVHEEALKRGVKVTGATVHYVDGGLDTGPIISQKAVEVLEGDTPETLQRRVMEQAEWELLPAAIDQIANRKDI